MVVKNVGVGCSLAKLTLAYPRTLTNIWRVSYPETNQSEI